MLTNAGAKLFDFGLAKPVRATGVADDSAMPTKSAGLTGKGTLQYMATESFRAAVVPPKTAGYSAVVSSTTTISTTGTRESAL